MSLFCSILIKYELNVYTTPFRSCAVFVRVYPVWTPFVNQVDYSKNKCFCSPLKATSNLQFVFALQYASNKQQARWSVTGSSHGDKSITTCRKSDIADINTPHHQVKSRDTALCWLLLNKSNQTIMSGVPLKWDFNALTTSKNLYFHAWEISTTAVPTIIHITRSDLYQQTCRKRSSE